jgi:hypothetical protein
MAEIYINEHIEILFLRKHIFKNLDEASPCMKGNFCLHFAFNNLNRDSYRAWYVFQNPCPKSILHTHNIDHHQCTMQINFFG